MSYLGREERGGEEGVYRLFGFFAPQRGGGVIDDMQG